MCLQKMMKADSGKILVNSMPIWKSFSLSEDGLESPIKYYLFKPGLNYPEGIIDNGQNVIRQGVFHASMSSRTILFGEICLNFEVYADEIAYFGLSGDLGLKQLKIEQDLHEEMIQVFKKRQVLGFPAEFEVYYGQNILVIDFNKMDAKSRQDAQRWASSLRHLDLNDMCLNSVQVRTRYAFYDICITHKIGEDLHSILEFANKSTTTHNK